jgi:hypothetical protein
VCAVRSEQQQREEKERLKWEVEVLEKSDPELN